MTKKILLMALMGIMISGAMLAQGPPDGPPPPDVPREKLEAMRVAFYTKQLNLTPEEAQVFWPVYNEYQAAMESLREEYQLERKNAKENFATMTDKEVAEMVDEMVVMKQRETDIFKTYHAKFKEVLPIRKVAVLYKTENDFKRFVLKQLADHRPGGGPGGPGGPGPGKHKR